MGDEALYYPLPFVLARWSDGRTSPAQTRFVSCRREEPSAGDEVMRSVELEEDGFVGFQAAGECLAPRLPEVDLVDFRLSAKESEPLLVVKPIQPFMACASRGPILQECQFVTADLSGRVGEKPQGL